MKYGLDVPIHGEYADPQTLAKLAIESEEAGWDGFFLQGGVLSDESMTDPWVALAAVAMQTQRIRIGSLVTALAGRRPWQVARQVVRVIIIDTPHRELDRDSARGAIPGWCTGCLSGRRPSDESPIRSRPGGDGFLTTTRSPSPAPYRLRRAGCPVSPAREVH